MRELTVLKPVETENKAEVYLIENFLSEKDCNYLITKIEENKRKSTVVDAADGSSSILHEGRTSSSADLHKTDPIIESLDRKMAAALPEYVNLDYGETPQGQKYEPGEFFSDHFDFFTDDIVKEGGFGTPTQGQRNWTFMINLNSVEEGGETDCSKLGLKFKPKQGQAVVWKNIDGRGVGNDYTFHAGRAPVSGNKYIITKWFRTGPLENLHIDTFAIDDGKRKFTTKEELPHFHEYGYELRDLPEDIWAYIQDIHRLMEHTEEDEPMSPDFISSTVSPVASRIMNMDRIPQLKKNLHEMLLPMHQEWAGDHKLEPATCYGIRSYQRGAVLKSHYDRVSELHVSGIICVEDKSEEPWALDITDHNGDEAHIFMKPGQILLYESATCLHGRSKPLNGEHYRNFFIHYKLSDWNYAA